MEKIDARNALESFIELTKHIDYDIFANCLTGSDVNDVVQKMTLEQHQEFLSLREEQSDLGEKLHFYKTFDSFNISGDKYLKDEINKTFGKNFVTCYLDPTDTDLEINTIKCLINPNSRKVQIQYNNNNNINFGTIKYEDIFTSIRKGDLIILGQENSKGSHYVESEDAYTHKGFDNFEDFTRLIEKASIALYTKGSIYSFVYGEKFADTLKNAIVKNAEHINGKNYDYSTSISKKKSHKLNGNTAKNVIKSAKSKNTNLER